MIARLRITRVLVLIVATAGPLWGAKVILQDGTIREGKILDETDGDVLMRIPHQPRPVLIPSEEVLSMTRDPVEKPPQDAQRYAQFEALIGGNVFVSKNIATEPATSLWLGTGLRFHPLIELGAGVHLQPLLQGELAVTDGATVRRYERFGAWGGGFAAKLFPFYARRWKIEPFLLTGYEWNRYTPKGSDDALKGGGLKGGFGASWPVRDRLYLEAQVVYRDLEYRRIFFQNREGTVTPAIESRSVFFGAGLSYRL